MKIEGRGMQVQLSKAAKHFFPNPNLEMVYFEAVANAIDAGATEIKLSLLIRSYNECDTLKVEVSDNGCGFDDRRFEKFSKLLETEQSNHKGLGRLVYLLYFRNIHVESRYEAGKKRLFVFNDEFDGSCDVEDCADTLSGTTFTMSGYKKDSIRTYDYIRASSVKKALKERFYPLLHQKRIDGDTLKITIEVSSETPDSAQDFYSDEQILTPDELPDLEIENLNWKEIDLIDFEYNLHFRVASNVEKPSVFSAVCIDGRTIDELRILKGEQVPDGYEAIFLLSSKFLDAKSDPSRQMLNLQPRERSLLKRLLAAKIKAILEARIPEMTEINKSKIERLNGRYPHLKGYLDTDTVGVVDEMSTLEDAHKKFINAQKRILEAEDLSNELFESSLDVANRVLTEYILYRQLIIRKLKESKPSDAEADIHKMIVPMRKTYHGDDLVSDIYNNNAWVLDDKYMNYRHVLSDQEIHKLIAEIDDESVDSGDNQRPDIAIIASNKLSADEPVDVVVIELKRMGVDYKQSFEVVLQLRQRARALLKVNPGKIQRMWFYGIVEFDDELLLTLKGDGWTKLYSSGTVYYKQFSESAQLEDTVQVPVGVFLLSYETVWADAESRNATFLKILKDSIRSQVERER